MFDAFEMLQCSECQCVFEIGAWDYLDSSIFLTSLPLFISLIFF